MKYKHHNKNLHSLLILEKTLSLCIFSLSTEVRKKLRRYKKKCPDKILEAQ